MDLVLALASKCNADVVIVAEPNVKKIRSDGWICDLKTDVGIKTCKPHAVVEIKRAEGLVMVELNQIVLIGVYISPNSELEFCSSVLDTAASWLNIDKPLVIAGDFNAKDPMWGGTSSNPRGRLVLEFLNQGDLDLANDGRVPTVCRFQGMSFVDLTMMNSKASRILKSWEVSAEDFLSDHSLIVSEFEDNVEEAPQCHRWKQVPGWLELYGDSIIAKIEETIHGDYRDVNKILQEEIAKISSTPKRKNNREVYWWSPELTMLRDVCRVSRRRMQRVNRRGRADLKVAAYADWCTKRREFKVAIIKAKQTKWEQLCDEVNADPWGQAYKIVTHKFGRALPRMTGEKARLVLRALFPVDVSPQLEEMVATDVVLFTQQEVLGAARSLSAKKSPGTDGVPLEVVKGLVGKSPKVFVDLYNRILLEEQLPLEWREARVVLLQKPGRDGRSPSDFRPICLINSLAKLYEKLLAGRLCREIEEKNGLHPLQFGFRRGRSTIDAVTKIVELGKGAKAGTWYTRRIPVVVMLDIKNAFNSVPWECILKAMKEMGFSQYLRRAVQNYLTNRSLVFHAEDGLVRCGMYRGVPQGSVIGPLLWNIAYDGVLRLPMPQGVTCVAFADDLAMFVEGRHEEEVIEKGNLAIDRVVRWLLDHGLEVAPEKTVALILAGRRNLGEIRLNVMQCEFQVVKEAKYLGIWLDSGLTFIRHVKEAVNKALRIGLDISRLMRNINGPAYHKRKLLCNVITSTLMYGVQVWGDSINYGIVRKSIDEVHRLIALRCSRAYRTVSSVALSVISGIPPLDLQISKRMMLSRGMNKAEAEEHMFDEWQRRWNTAREGRWTFLLIPELKPWVLRKHGEVSFELCQFLSGHGSFGEYLNRINKGSIECRYCGELDSPRHTFFACYRWDRERDRLTGLVGPLDPRGLVMKMVDDKKVFEAVLDFVNIMKIKLADERSR